jgi:allantoate deiminase
MDATNFPREAAGRTVLERVAALGRHSDSAEHYTRTVFTAAHGAAARRIEAWMKEAGMEVAVDAIGNVRGKYGARRETRGKAIVMGSHFDSVRNGGKYDGVLGILVPIACVAELHRREERLPYDTEVVAFSDEEGARFQTSFLSSRALIGRFDAALLERRDAEGVTLADAMRAVGLDPARIPEARIDPAGIAAYVEVHIEQGPVLLREDRALGVVTVIAAGARHSMTVIGESGHAGTVPMDMRHDALAAAAEMVLAIERRCASGRGLVGTVGLLEVKSGSGNVIPGEVRFSVDIRSTDEAILAAAQREVFAELDAIAARRGVRLEGARTHDVRAVPCAPWLQDRIAASIERVTGRPARRLPSGAGHDAMIVAEVADVGMLFVRCGAGGVSHNPAETVSAEDCGIAVEAVLDFLRRFEGPAVR